MKKLHTISFCVIIAITTFTSCKKTKIPVISTKTAVEITNYSAISGGIINDDKIGIVLEKGICWSTKPNPTINDARSIEQSGGLEFTSSLMKLNPQTTYFYRAYATNEAGTGYGEEYSIKTGSIIEFTLNSVTFQVYPIDNAKAIEWGAMNNGTLANSDNSGQQNTQLIIASSSNSAAKICKDLNYMDKADWFMPARSELNKIFEIKTQFSAGNLENNYWSSTELNPNQAYSQDFISGEITASTKSAKINLRCIRKKD